MKKHLFYSIDAEIGFVSFIADIPDLFYPNHFLDKNTRIVSTLDSYLFLIRNIAIVCQIFFSVSFFWETGMLDN
jgi:hypothetical protein